MPERDLIYAQKGVNKKPTKAETNALRDAVTRYGGAGVIALPAVEGAGLTLAAEKTAEAALAQQGLLGTTLTEAGLSTPAAAAAAETAAAEAVPAAAKASWLSRVLPWGRAAAAAAETAAATPGAASWFKPAAGFGVKWGGLAAAGAGLGIGLGAIPPIAQYMANKSIDDSQGDAQRLLEEMGMKVHRPRLTMGDLPGWMTGLTRAATGDVGVSDIAAAYMSPFRSEAANAKRWKDVGDANYVVPASDINQTGVLAYDAAHPKGFEVGSETMDQEIARLKAANTYQVLQRRLARLTEAQNKKGGK